MDMLVWGFETGKSWKEADYKVVSETQGPIQKSNPSHSHYVSPDEG